MTTPSFYESLLKLPREWRIDHVEVDEVLVRVNIYLSYLPMTGPHPETLEECSVYDLRPEREWRHLDTMQYKTYLRARLPRVMGKDGKPVTIAIPWSEASSRQTWFLEAWAIQVLLASKNQTQSARLLRMSFAEIHRIMHRAVERGLEARQQSFQDGTLQVRSISIDEKYYKHKRFLSVVSDPARGAILEVADGRTTTDAVECLEAAIPVKQRVAVTTATVDMSEAYRKAILKVLPKAWVVYDKFHLFMYLTAAIDQTRRQEVHNNPVLKNTRFLWLKNAENQTRKEQASFGQISELNLKTSVAWRIRENFKSLYECESPKAALNFFLRWQEHARASGIKPIVKVAETFGRHIKGIINHFYDRESNAMAERLNGKIQELKVIGKGYRNFEQLRIAILFFFGKLDLVSHKSQ